MLAQERVVVAGAGASGAGAGAGARWQGQALGLVVHRGQNWGWWAGARTGLHRGQYRGWGHRGWHWGQCWNWWSWCSWVSHYKWFNKGQRYLGGTIKGRSRRLGIEPFWFVAPLKEELVGLFEPKFFGFVFLKL